MTTRRPRRSATPGREGTTGGLRDSQESGPRDGSADVLQVFARLEPDGPARRNAHFLAGPGVAPDAALAGLDLKDAEPSQLDPVAALHRHAHRVEHRIHRQLG